MEGMDAYSPSSDNDENIGEYYSITFYISSIIVMIRNKISVFLIFCTLENFYLKMSIVGFTSKPR